MQQSACAPSALDSRRRKNECRQPARGNVTLKQASDAFSDASETGAGRSGAVPPCRLRQLTTVKRVKELFPGNNAGSVPHRLYHKVRKQLM